MKNLTIKTAMLLFICLLSVNTVMAKSKNLKYDSLSCLRIDGIISNANEGLDGECTIETIHSDGVIDTLMLKEGKKKFGLVLEKNSYYAIRISKKGYISKIIAINTEIVTELDGVQIFEFEASLIKESAKNKLNQDILDFPVAIIYFDYEADSFSYNKEYSTYIKRELYKVKPNPTLQKTNESLISETSKALAYNNR